MTPVNILLVDDRPSNLLALAAMLKNPEYNLVQAASGEDALRAILKQDFALVLLDVQMPGLDGFETAAHIRSRKRTSVLPLIFITAYDKNDTQISRGYQLGAVDYIFKPIVPEVLQAKVQVFVDLYKKTAELERQMELQRLSENALRQSEQRYRHLFSSASEAVFLVDEGTDEILDLNDAAVVLYRGKREELLGMKWKELSRGSSAEAKALQQTRLDGTTFLCQIDENTLQLTDRFLRTILVRDLTDTLKAQETQRLLERDQMQREFVANVSHELRTPIAAIKGFAETLRRGGLNDKRNRLGFVKIIEAHAERLHLLVEDLLVLSAIESGKFSAFPAPVNLRGFVSGYLESIAPLIDRKKSSLIVEVPEAIELWADPKHLAQVFQNLVDNALKYGKMEGTIAIRARLEGKSAHIEVADDGQGIKPEELPQLFTRFHRCQATKATQGWGLGLYIVRLLIEGAGGRIWAESEPGKGATFHFTVPVKAPVKAARSLEAAQNASSR
jgi:signal transduction histidine kinase